MSIPFPEAVSFPRLPRNHADPIVFLPCFPILLFLACLSLVELQGWEGSQWSSFNSHVSQASSFYYYLRILGLQVILL